MISAVIGLEGPKSFVYVLHPHADSRCEEYRWTHPDKSICIVSAKSFAKEAFVASRLWGVDLGEWGEESRGARKDVSPGVTISLSHPPALLAPLPPRPCEPNVKSPSPLVGISAQRSAAIS